MQSETIVAVFDTRAHAELAIADLQASGVPGHTIEHYARDDEADGGEVVATHTTSHNRGFWGWLTGEPERHEEHHALYEHSLQSGSTVVTVVTDGIDAEKILAILEEHAPIDLDERHSQYREAGAYGADVALGMAGGDGMVAGTAGAGMVGGSAGAGMMTDPAAAARRSETLATGTVGTGMRGTEMRDMGVRDTDMHEAGMRDTGALAAGSRMGDDAAIGGIGGGTREETLSLSEETLEVGKRDVDRGTTRVRRYVVERPVEEQVRLRDERVTVFRRPVTAGRAASGDAFTAREISMTEHGEEAVVSKSTHVVEEVVLQKEAAERVETVRDTVRRDEVEIEGGGTQDR